MRFDELAPDNEVVKRLGPPEVEVWGLAYRSQDVKEGWLFAAIPGATTDGHLFIPHAIKAGARALIVKEAPADLPELVGIAVVENPRKALASAAGRFFGLPSRRVDVIGVTGTNGKTTTAFLMESILREEALNPAVIGTINYRLGELVYPAPVTTPESVDLQRTLAEMLEKGAKSAVVEVSSHALHQGRVWGLKFAARVFTNLSHDHLDYHNTMKEYFQAKSLLFTDREFKDSGPSVINIDDPWGRKLAEIIGENAVTYGVTSPEASIKVTEASSGDTGLKLKIASPAGEMDVKSELLGRVNIYNILAAVAAATALNLGINSIKKGIEAVRAVPGRLEPVLNERGINVLVDYSHTPDALEKVIQTVREFTTGKLFVVFGCGGDRDRKKRPMMGKIAATLADAVVVTSDNPRSEDPMDIISGILAGVYEAAIGKRESYSYPETTGVYWVEPDRRKAIGQAIELARKSDAVIIAGKGHEDYQIIGDQRIHFDDREVAREALGG